MQLWQYSLIIIQPTNALIVCHLFLNHFLKQRTQIQDMLPQQYYYEKFIF